MVETIVLSITIPILYLFLTVCAGRIYYRRTKWASFTTPVEKQFFSLLAGIMWPFVIPAVILMIAVTPANVRSEERRKRLSKEVEISERTVRVQNTILDLIEQGRLDEARRYKIAYESEIL